ncbi:MAG: hypothetical protein ACREU7_04395 [Burkholderiales bacterium]
MTSHAYWLSCLHQVLPIGLPSLTAAALTGICFLAIPTPRAGAEPARIPTAWESDAQCLGAAAGVVSPRLADCQAHCAKALGEVTPAMREERRGVFTRSCRDACETQIAGTSADRQRARDEAAKWLLEQEVWCIKERRDRSAEATALVAALDAAKKSPESVAADDAEQRAAQLAKQLSRTERGRRVTVARAELHRANDAAGVCSAAAETARRAVADAEAAAHATRLGGGVREAMEAAQAARAKANETAAMDAAARAFQAHGKAMQMRISNAISNASKEERARLLAAVTPMPQSATVATRSKEELERALAAVTLMPQSLTIAIGSKEERERALAEVTACMQSWMQESMRRNRPDQKPLPRESSQVPATEQARPATKREEPMSESDAKRLGAAAGVVSPRLADCSAHCAKELGDVTGAISEQSRVVFTQSCRDACQKQMAESTGPARQRAHNAAADWRSLYLTTALLEQRVWCIRQLSDESAEAVALVNALAAAKKSTDSLAADELERRAADVAAQLARTEEGRRVTAAREHLARVNNSDGPRSAAAAAAREAVSDARAAAKATPLGKRLEDAVTESQAARAKANQSAAMTEALRTFEEHTKAWHAKVVAASPAEQSRLHTAMSGCIDSWGKEQKRGR